MMQWTLLKMTIFVIAFFSPCIYDMSLYFRNEN